MEDVYVRYLTTHSQGRLATVGPDGGPQNKPVGYRYNAKLGTIDIGGYANALASAARPRVIRVVLVPGELGQ
jgi:pyridoxamine 5'-phosphate oxidase family protein